jgi:hypothetical protein
VQFPKGTGIFLFATASGLWDHPSFYPLDTGGCFWVIVGYCLLNKGTTWFLFNVYHAAFSVLWLKLLGAGYSKLLVLGRSRGRFEAMMNPWQNLILSHSLPVLKKIYMLIRPWSRVSTVTSWTGSIPCRNKDFSCTLERPDRIWDPTNLLSNGYQELFLRV